MSSKAAVLRSIEKIFERGIEAITVEELRFLCASARALYRADLTNRDGADALRRRRRELANTLTEDVPPNPLDALIQQAVLHEMSPMEILDQKTSWVWGQMPDSSRARTTRDAIRKRIAADMGIVI